MAPALNCALVLVLLLWREHQQDSTDHQGNDNIREVPVYTVLSRLDSLDCHHRAVRQVPPRCKDDEQSMGRPLPAGDEKEGAECDEETEEHGFRFVVHHQEPLGMPQVCK
jgi:hypothetical protein